MIGTRTRYSLAQFLELQEPMLSIVLLSKYGGVQHLSLSPGQSRKHSSWSGHSQRHVDRRLAPPRYRT